MQNSYKELPDGYECIYHINAKDTKIGLIMNVFALVIMVVVMAICVLPLILAPEVDWGKYDIVAIIITFLCYFAYIVLHELVHGIAYKSLTKEKLTFGLSWSCAFCGVPNVYVNRKTALISLTAPLIVFTLLFTALTVVLYFVNTFYYLCASLLLSLHLGGCVGDIYMTALFLFKFKQKDLLMRDTGPEQFVYIKKQN
ncbi:MAG: DUF3267 domain-containing protein [Clostridia bacterium]|nr:DUF3267 domain-containing protein [Clostridia bacterium]